MMGLRPADPWPASWFLLLNVYNCTVMAGNRSAHQDIVLLGEDLHDLQALHLYPVTAHPARHANAFHNAAGVGGVTKRTRSTLTVVLTVRLLTYPMESMTLDDTLKTFTLGCAHDFHFLTFGENVYSNGLTKSLCYGEIAKFFYELFGRSVGFGEVILLSGSSVFLFLVAKC